MRTLASRTIRPNHSTRWPNRYIFAAVAGDYEQTPIGAQESFRLGVLRYELRRPGADTFTHRDTIECDDASSLWKQVEDWRYKDKRTVLIAHNVSRFLQVSDAFRQLSALGAEFQNGMIDNGRAWCTWKLNSSTLIITDLASWSSMSVRRMASVVGHGQGPLEVQATTSADVSAALRSEVEVIADCWHRCRAWCEENDCGMFRPTGAGQSWAAYRHKFLHRGIVHHGDETLYVRERRAVWAGRAEAWRHGVMPFATVDEWDMHLAYARIGQTTNLPTRVLGTVASLPVTTVMARGRTMALLADCTITTEVPCVPCEVDGRITWPVGTFATTLWNPEITLAVRCGAKVECSNVVMYRAQPILKDWADWVIGLLDENTGVSDVIVHAMLKSWARTVVGRFGLRYASWESIGTLDPPTFGGWPLYEYGKPGRSRLMAIGHTMFQEGELTESPDSAPAVMGFIMSACRARLFDAMRGVGLDHVLYVDTDGMLLDPIGSAKMERAAGDWWRRKHSYERVEILGPRQLIVGREVKASGVPFRARTTDGHRWEGEAESSPFGGLRAGAPGALIVRSLQGRISAQDKRRRHTTGGTTKPYRLSS